MIDDSSDEEETQSVDSQATTPMQEDRQVHALIVGTYIETAV